MKLLLLLNIIIVFNFSILAQTSHWTKNINYSSSSQSKASGIDSFGNIYVAGTYHATNHDYTNPAGFFISKFSSSGTLVWSDTSNASFAAECGGIAVDETGNSYIIGRSLATGSSIRFGTFLFTNSTTSDMFFVKYNSAGAVQWAKQINGANPKSIYLDADGFISVSGACNSSQFGTFSIAGGGFVAKFDQTGNCLNAISNPSTIYSAKWDRLGNIFFIDCLNSSNPYLIKKIDDAGNLIWSRILSNLGGQLSIDLNGNCYVTGPFIGNITFGATTLTGSGTGGYGAFICRLDSLGNYDLILSADSTAGHLVEVDNQGNIYTDYSDPLSGLKISKFDSFGNYTHVYTIPPISPNYYYIANHLCLKENNISIAGNCSGQYPHAFISRIFESPLSVKTINSKNVSQFEIYPNPSEGIFYVTCYINDSKKMKLNVLNVKGQIIYSQSYSPLNGSFKAVVDIGGTAKGLYYVEVISESYREVKKITIQ